MWKGNGKRKEMLEKELNMMGMGQGKRKKGAVGETEKGRKIGRG